MGIVGLLPFLKKSSKNSHLRNFSGSTAAVDGFGWLHKGAFGCAVKLGMGEPTDVYVNYFMKYINVLLEHKIKPVVVFDGRSLPAKAATNQKRREVRTASRKKAQDMMRRGDKKGAWEHFVKAIEITHAMVLEVIKVLRQKHIDYIVAPYEADAQLAYLARNGFVDFVVTEDSDLVPFGCPKILFKLSTNGDCVLFTQEKVHVCMDVPKNKYNFEHFRHMCILSGCDYLESLPKVGLTRAKKIIVALLTAPDGVVVDIIDAIRRIPSTLNLDVQVTEEYIQDFIDANNSFLYQLVFDPVERKVKPLNPYPEGFDKDEFSNAGTYDLSHEEFFQIAIGNMNTKTLTVVGTYNIDKDRGFVNKDTSIWSKKFKALKIENGDAGWIVTTSTVLHADSAMVTGNVKTKKKRPLASNAINSTEDDNAELNEIYGQQTKVVSIEEEDEEKEESPTKQRSKRTRMSMISQDTVELRASKNPFGESSMNDEEQKTEEDLNTSVNGISLRKRKPNPFLKSPDIGKVARARMLNSSSSEDGSSKVVNGVNGYANCDKQPICLIEKNRIYNIDAKLIVKSKYFREPANTQSSSSTQNNSSASSVYENEYSELDSQLSIYSIDKDQLNFDSESVRENDLCPIELPGGDDDDAQETENDAQEIQHDAQTESNEAQVINLDDEEDEDCSSYFTNPSKLNGVSKGATIKKSPVNTPPLTRAKANKKGSCRSQGLIRNSKKDSAQPSLQMFGFRAKPKI